MKHHIVKIKRAALWAVTFVVASPTQPLLASEWRLHYGLSNNSDALHVAGQYSYFDDSGEGNSSSFLVGGEKKPSSFSENWLLSFGASKTFEAGRLGAFRPGLGLSAQLGHFKAHFPQGSGAFVEPITVTSHSLGLSASLFLRSDPLFDHLTLETGIQASAIQSRETFVMGQWDIKETTSFERINIYARAQYDFAPLRLSKSTSVTPAAYLQIERSDGINQVLFGIKVSH